MSSNHTPGKATRRESFSQWGSCPHAYFSYLWFHPQARVWLTCTTLCTANNKQW